MQQGPLFPPGGDRDRPSQKLDTSGGAGWGRRTNPLDQSRSVPALPALAGYDDTPRYTLNALSDLVGVRVPALWNWVNYLNRVPQGVDPQQVRYSERDVIAFVWLRNFVIAGGDVVVGLRTINEAMGAARTALMSSSPSRPLGNANRPASRPLPESGTPSRSLGTGARAGSQWSYVPPIDFGGSIERLLQSSAMLDMATFNRLLDEIHQAHPLDVALAGVYAPIISRIREIWMPQSDTMLPEAAFALNLLRQRLGALMEALPLATDGPVAYLACGPDEIHDLDALVLAALWRQRGIQVLYFGMKTDGNALIEQVRRHEPRLVALTIYSQTRLRLVSRFVRDLGGLQLPQTSLFIISPTIARDPGIRDRLGVPCLGGDVSTITRRIAHMLAI